MKKPLVTKAAVYVGSTPESIKEYKAAILAIMGARADQKTIRHALSCLMQGVQVNNASLQNMSVSFTEASEDKKPLNCTLGGESWISK